MTAATATTIASSDRAVEWPNTAALDQRDESLRGRSVIVSPPVSEIKSPR